MKTLIPITMWALLLLAGCAVPTVEAHDLETIQPTATAETGHQLSGEAIRAAARGQELRRQGHDEEAILKFQEVLEVHGRPSTVLENALCGSHPVLRQHEAAVRHYTRAIEARDNPVSRVNRSSAYAALGRCQTKAKVKHAEAWGKVAGDLG